MRSKVAPISSAKHHFCHFDHLGLDALPRNNMGKIQRDVLKKSAASSTAGEGQQRRRSQRLARKLDKPARLGTKKRN